MLPPSSLSSSSLFSESAASSIKLPSFFPSWPVSLNFEILADFLVEVDEAPFLFLLAEFLVPAEGEAIDDSPSICPAFFIPSTCFFAARRLLTISWGLRLCLFLVIINLDIAAALCFNVDSKKESVNKNTATSKTPNYRNTKMNNTIIKNTEIGKQQQRHNCLHITFSVSGVPPSFSTVSVLLSVGAWFTVLSSPFSTVATLSAVGT